MVVLADDELIPDDAVPADVLPVVTLWLEVVDFVVLEDVDCLTGTEPPGLQPLTETTRSEQESGVTRDA